MTLYLAFGTALFDLCDVMINDVCDAKNKYHFDKAVTKLAAALANVGSQWIQSFAAIVLSVFGRKVKGTVKARLAKPSVPPIEAPAVKAPSPHRTGGVH